MSDADTQPSAGWRLYATGFALAVSIFTVLWFIVGALGTRFGLWPYQVGLSQMTFGLGANLAMLSVALGGIGVIIALIQSPRKQPFILALAALLIGGLMLGRLAGFRGEARALPPLHDIQTDWAAPIAFSETLMQAREMGGAANDVLDAPIVPEGANGGWPGTGGRLVSELQEDAERSIDGADPIYPRLDPLYFAAPPAEIAEAAETVMKRRGWTIVTEAEEIEQGVFQVEATETSTWFGFEDDVAIRVQDSNGGAKLDIRSTSRVGLSDIGANSKRVSALLVEMQDRLDGRWEP
ncbi:MAG: DUF1499 domain-containing protein [Pseudomonadota bacterium]